MKFALIAALALIAPAVHGEVIDQQLLDRLAAQTGQSGPPIDPSKYSLGAAPIDLATQQQLQAQLQRQSSAPAVERQKTFDGTGYTIIAPIFLGINGNSSYIRFWNIALSPVVISGNVIGWPSGTNYGSAAVTVPSLAAPQYAATDIMTAAGATTSVVVANGDQGVTFYVAHNANLVGFQHVIYNTGSQFFENVSLCQKDSLANVDAYLMNVHTSQISGYPSIIYLHNYASYSQGIKIYLVDARTGGALGSTTYSLRANNTYAVPVSQIESDAGVTPTSSQLHYNLLFADSGTNKVATNIMLGQVIYNSGLKSYVNMSDYCDIK